MTDLGDRAQIRPAAWLAWNRSLARHRLLLTAILLITGILFSWLSSGVRWQSDILAFFSSSSDDVRNMHAATASFSGANQMRIDVHGLSDADTTAAAAKDLAQALRASGQFRSVWDGIDPLAAASAYAALASDAPMLLDDPQAPDAAASGPALATRFKAVRDRLVDPDGEIALQQLRADPLGLGTLAAGRLQSLSPVGGADASLVDGVLIALDDRHAAHAMLVCDPIVPASDQAGAQKMLAAVHAAATATATHYPGAATWVVGPHRGYVDNAQRIKTDVTWVSLVGTLAVAAAIAVYFRRLSTALLCVIPPAVGVGLALGIAGAARLELPLLLLGFAGLLCGSTTDYGIQLIAECRRRAAAAGGWDETIPTHAARALLGPISMSVATSVTGFAALGLSQSPGLQALGLFVAGATLCIWAITFLVLPAFLGPWVLPRRPLAPVRPRRWVWPAATAAFVALTTFLAVHAARVRFVADPRPLDGSSAALLADQDAFFHVWGDIRNRALVLVHGATPDAALDTLHRINDYLQDQLHDGLLAAVSSPAQVLPDAATAATRAAAWRSYWTEARRSDLRDRLTAAARSAGFAPTAFAAYPDRLADYQPRPPTQRLASSPVALFPGLVQTTADRITLASIVQMRSDLPPERATGWAGELRLRFPGAVQIVSGSVLINDATDHARAEGERLAPLCILAILLPLWIYFRRLRRAGLAMICLMVGLIWVLGAADAIGSGLNLLSLVPLLFTLGVAVDYGIYAVSDPALRTGGPTRLSATGLCALTTILGSGSLALASHPALRWLGITLVSGVVGGYLTSLLIVAPLRRWTAARRPSRWLTLARWALSGAAGALALLLALPVVAEAILAHQHPDHLTAAPPLHVDQPARRTFYALDSSGNLAGSLRLIPTAANEGLWQIVLRGSPQQRGAAVGLLASPLDYRIETEMLAQVDDLLPRESTRYLVLHGMGANLIDLQSYIPEEVREEIAAAAESYSDPHAYLAPTYPRILAYHALHDISQMLIDNPLIVPNTFACTGVISLPAYSGPDGHLFLARNFDFEGGESFGRQKSITFVIPADPAEIPFAHVAWPGLAGCVTGMNRERIALFINAAATSDFRRIGTPTILMAREVLEHARSLDDADRIIRATPVFVSDILVVADGKTGQARVFEKSPAATDAYDVHDSAAVANHLTTPRFAADHSNQSRITDSTTMQRYRRARELLDRLHNRVTPDALAALLRDKQGIGDKDLGFGNRNAIDGLIACHSVIMDVTAGKMWVAGWPNAEGRFVAFDVMAQLDAFAKGEDAAPADAALQAESPGDVAEDRILTDGTWVRITAARDAAERSTAALARRDWPGALAQAQVVVANNGAFYLGHALAGKALLELGRLPEARVELQRALDADPPYASRRKELEGMIHACGAP